jgi:hypothetical protein
LRDLSPQSLISSPRALVQLRDGSWVIIGSRNLEPKGIDAFEILDPIPVSLDYEGYLIAADRPQTRMVSG